MQLRRRVLGDDHPDTLQSKNNLAHLYHSQGRYGEAEPLYRETSQLRRQVLGDKHPNTLGSMNNLAGLYRSQGRFGKAEPIYRKTLQLSRQVLGDNHPSTLISMHNLALLYEKQGRHGDAEPLFRETLHLSRQVLGDKHPDTLTSMHSLAYLYASQGRYGEAEPLYRETLQLKREVLGDKHPNTLASMNNLAGLYEKQGRYGDAEPLFRETLLLYTQVLGDNHPDTLTIMNNLAYLYASQGRYRDAEPLYRETLLLYSQVLGDNHPLTLQTQLNSTRSLINLGKIPEALRQLRQMEPALLTWLGAELYSTESAGVRAGLVASQSTYQHVALSLALQAAGEPDALQLAASAILRFKGLIAEEEAYLARIARRGQDPRAQDLAREIAALRATLAKAFHGGGVDVDALKRDLDAKELALGKVSRDYAQRLQVRNANLADLQLTLDPDEALLELRQYEQVDFKTGTIGEERYAGILVTGNSITIKDLGAITMPETFDDAAAQELHERLLAPFAVPLLAVKTLYLAPDGPLHLLPFATLRGADGIYLIEALDLRLVQTGRDLLRPAPDRKAKGLLALGGIDFDQVATDIATIEPAAGPELQSAFLAPLDGDALRSLTETSFRDGFNALPASRSEVEGIRNLYQLHRRDEPLEIWQDQSASETRLKSLSRPPRVLHLATHGFYRQPARPSDRPMLLSGVTLSGANQALADAGEDGILYAIEAQSLNLEGTELVVLSACDTAKGQPAYGEGVYGLVRALRTAGAAHVLVTLSPVPDAGASTFMQAFYRHMLQEDITPAQALRATKLDYINSPDQKQRNPTAWGPYQLIGG